ncbi:hypothetical protein FJY70_01030 [candidate division WOR-3 bacterium]|nr:hypothetical protein [candidate division WOR-3 bacterium]
MFRVNDGRFAAAINCMDGRTQAPVNEWMRREYGVDFVDTITEPGPVRILAEASDASALASIRRRLSISVSRHGSVHVAIVAHADCAGNPTDQETQLRQLRRAAETVRSWGMNHQLDLLWLGLAFQVERLD